MEEVNTQNQGTSEGSMINKLKEKGVAPKDINDALNREKIKSAVSAEPGGEGSELQPSVMSPDKPQPLPTEGIELSDEDLTPPPAPARERDYSPKTREISEDPNPVPQIQEAQSEATQEYIPQPQEYIPPPTEYAPQENYDYPPEMTGTTNTDTMIEISEQVFFEKIKTIQKHVDDMNEFKTLSETKIDHISTRLKRIETVIDDLQKAILEKVGSYGRNLESIKKEMSMMQDSFGKMIGNIAEKHSHAHTHHTIRKKTTVLHKSSKKRTKK